MTNILKISINRKAFVWQEHAMDNYVHYTIHYYTLSIINGVTTNRLVIWL